MLTDTQKRALDLVVEGNGKPITRIGGYAGTGKTTLLAEAARMTEYDILSPTNKAADVLRRKGVARARTLHSVLYNMAEVITYRSPDGKETKDVPLGGGAPEGWAAVGSRLIQMPATEERAKSPVCIVDEASMVREEDLDTLLGAYRRVVLIGDPFQLPPVKSRDVFTDDVDVFLTEVHRTALDNPITAFATALRNGEQPPAPDGKVIVEVGASNKHLMPRLSEVDGQCVVWTNALRHHINAQFRAARGYPRDRLAKGERVVCLENVRRTDPETGNPVLVAYNGQTCTLDEDGAPAADFMKPMVLPLAEVEPFRAWPFWVGGFHQARSKPSWYDRAKQHVDRPHTVVTLDHAYALTAHKAQGSEFETVAVWDQREAQRRTMGQREAARWFYTAVTRARERLVLVAA